MTALHQTESDYGKKRRTLGIGYVGTYVLLSLAALISGWASKQFGTTDPSFVHWFRNIICLTAAYEFIGIPFDVIGISIDRRYRRTTSSLVSCLTEVLKSVGKHAVLCIAFAFFLTAEFRVGGFTAIAIGSTCLSLFYLWKQAEIARFLSDIYFIEPNPITSIRFSNDKKSRARLVVARTEELGFTGGTIGLMGSTSIVVPENWLETMSGDEFWTAVTRRDLAVVSGNRRRGVTYSILFTVAGILLAAIVTDKFLCLSIDTTAGLVDFSCVYTLWSFLGLLLLPSVSQQAVMQADQAVVEFGVAKALLAKMILVMDRQMEDEIDRSDAVQFVFHPIPSPNRRLATGSSIKTIGGAWNVARYTVSLSIIGLSLLNRAVHCNAGKPDLWSILPAD